MVEQVCSPRINKLLEGIDFCIELVEGVDFFGILLYQGTDHRLVVVELSGAVGWIQFLLNNGAKVCQVALAPGWNGQHFVEQRVVNLVGVVEWPPVACVIGEHGAVAVELKGRNSTGFSLVVQVIIHFSLVHIAIVIGKGDFGRQEPQCSVNIQVIW